MDRGAATSHSSEEFTGGEENLSPRAGSDKGRGFGSYLVAVLCVLVAFGIRYFLTPVLGEELPFMLFIAAALVSAWYGGAVMGVVSLMLGLLLSSHFFSRAGLAAPTHPLEIRVIQLIRYLFTASLGIALIEVQHRGRRRTQMALEEVEREIARRRRSEAALVAAKAELSRHAQELERRVEERTAKLAASMTALQELLYHIAHNLRAPLRAMEGYTTLLLSEYGPRLDERSQEYSRHISDAARRMDVLIRDLLDYGHLGHQEVHLVKTNLGRAVQRIRFQLGYLIQESHAEITIVEPMPQVWASRDLLDPVLVNLLENALKFVSPGTAPRVRIWTGVRGGVVRLWFEDNGIGIEPRFHERIFRAFETLLPAENYEGTGIGLAIVKQGIQQMGGRVGVESMPGAGSRFWVELKQA